MSNEDNIVEASSTSSSVAPPPSSSSSPSWAELPREITANILQRLGAVEILVSAQRVCATWWYVCHDYPSMWHVIDMKTYGVNIEKYELSKLCQIAVDRSQGQLRKISIHNFGNKYLLNYIAERSSQLKHLCLVNSSILAGGLAAAAKDFPLLEELHIYFTYITEDDIEIVGRSCPLLKSFILSTTGYGKVKLPESQYDDQALAIARSMPELRDLVLIDSSLTYGALQAILDGCPHLEWFDLRCSCCDLGTRFGQLVVSKHPRDSTHVNDIASEIWHYWSSEDYDCDYDYDSYY